MSTDKLGSLLRKYRTLVDAQADVHTSDGYVLRLYSIGFTKKLNSTRKACYAQQSKKKEIRDTCVDVMKSHAEKMSINDLCASIVGETIEKEIVEKCKSIMQVENVFVTKIKVLKTPVFTEEQLRRLHSGRFVPLMPEIPRPEETLLVPALVIA
jgi:small subunit ribosomal protein S3Ae